MNIINPVFKYTTYIYFNYLERTIVDWVKIKCVKLLLYIQYCKTLELFNSFTLKYIVRIQWRCLCI